MNNRQLTGLIALVLVVIGLGVLTYYTYDLGRRGTALSSAVSEPPKAVVPATPAPSSEPLPVERTTAMTPDEPEKPGKDEGKDESRLGETPAAGATPKTAQPTIAAPPADTPAAPAPEPERDTAMVSPAEPAAPAEKAAIPELNIDVTGERPAAGAAPTNVPTFDVVRVEPTGETAVAGLAAPGAKVELMDGDQVVASAQANSRGEWTMILDQPLKPGTHDLALRATSPDGAEQFLSEQRVAVAVPDTGSREVLAVVNEPGAPSRVLAKPEEGAAVAAAPPAKPEPAPSSMAERFTNAEPPPKPAVTVDAVEADPDGGLYIAGTAKTPDPVRIYLNDQLIGEAKPGPEGKWLHEGVRRLDPGKYAVRADQVSPKSGEVLVRSEVTFEREAEVVALAPTAEMAAPAGAEASGTVESPTTVIIRRGDNLWTISRRWYGRGIRYSTIYEANTDQIRDPHWIYPGQVFVMPKGDAKWTIE
jgi:nucleoid-associated protein YgaU